MSETHSNSRLTNWKYAAVELAIVGLAIKVIGEFYRWCNEEVSQLSAFVEKETREWSRLWKGGCELFALEQDGVGIVRNPAFKVIGDSGQYSQLFSSYYSMLEMIVLVQKEKEPQKICSSQGLVEVRFLGTCVRIMIIVHV